MAGVGRAPAATGHGAVLLALATTDTQVPATGTALASDAAQRPQPSQTPPTVAVLTPDVAAQIAHSALLSVEGTATADTLQIRIHRANDKSLLSGEDVTVAIDGKSQSVTRNKDGAYEVQSSDLRGGGPHDVEVIVAHDGIREIVAGKVSVGEVGSADSLLRDHKQIAWWILNIVIVLIAVMAISRRKG